MNTATPFTAGAWTPPAQSSLLLGGKAPAMPPATTFHRYALCPAPWGWHMRRVPALRAPLLPRLDRKSVV